MGALAQTRISQVQAINFYVGLIGILGAAFAIRGVINLAGISQPLSLFLLALLIVVTAVTSTSMNFNERINITYQIDSAIALAALPLYGPSVAALLITISSITMWLVKRGNRVAWKKTGKQLIFNTGMLSISCTVAGYSYISLQSNLANAPFVFSIFPWLAAAIMFEMVNTLLLSVILRIQNGSDFNLFEMFGNSVVFYVLGILINAVGAGFIAYALVEVGWAGIIVFFLPVVASAYAFRTYVKGVEAHMNNLEEIVDKRTKALQQLNKEKSLFLAVLAHDMRTPLTSINLYSEMLEYKPHLAVEKPRIIRSIRDSQQHLLELVNNILDLEKLEEGNEMELDYEKFNLTETLDLLYDRLEAHASFKSIELAFNYTSDYLAIHGDRSQILRVFSNLISNAIKYSPQNSNIFVDAAQFESDVVVTVRDTGYGIPADAIDTIFDRYSRVENHKNKAVGTGLGLAITKAIVNAHSGQITVESKENIGTTFTVSLPIGRI